MKMTPAREAEIRALLVSETYLVAMPRSQALAWQAVRDLLAALEEARCLPGTTQGARGR